MPIPGFFFSRVRGPGWLNPHIDPSTRNRINLSTASPDTGVTFRGGGGYSGGFSFWFNDERYTMSAILWFWLPESHMIEGVYTIQPVANLTGELSASTEGRSFWEEPVLTAEMDLSYEMHFGDRSRVMPPQNFSLVNLHRRSNARIHRTYRGDRFLFPHTILIVDRPAPLVLKLEIEMRFWRDASGNFGFLPYGSDEFFRIDVPRWRLGYRALDDPSILT